jgi:hypothetical protein
MVLYHPYEKDERGKARRDGRALRETRWKGLKIAWITLRTELAVKT